MKTTAPLLLMGAVFLLMTPGTAHAYLDPGTGSLILQGLVATILGVTFTVRMYWSRLKGWWSGEGGGDGGLSGGD